MFSISKWDSHTSRRPVFPSCFGRGRSSGQSLLSGTEASPILLSRRVYAKDRHPAPNGCASLAFFCVGEERFQTHFLPLPLGEVSAKQTERAKRRKSDTTKINAQHKWPSQARHMPRQLSQRESQVQAKSNHIIFSPSTPFVPLTYPQEYTTIQVEQRRFPSVCCSFVFFR